MAELRQWHGVCLTIHMRKRLARLFTIKTRFEAWVVIYAIALGAVERGQHYLVTYPGFGGWLLAFACTGVVFLAGAKLLDSVRPAKAAVQVGPYAGTMPRHTIFNRSRPRSRRPNFGSTSPIWLRKD
jgi:hypothetical protein